MPRSSQRIFHLYAYGNLTLDGLIEQINAEGMVFRASQSEFPRSSVHKILKDRAQIGETLHKGQWYPGNHEPLIDRATWDRVQVLLGGHIYLSHALTYASDLIQCAHCWHRSGGQPGSLGPTGCSDRQP
ncbi:MAG: recombinase family protein [Isosphaeraceae bacterium]